MKTNHLPINWTDGVKLCQEHFFQNYFSILETIKNYSLIAQEKYNYGILEGINGSTDALKIDLLNESGQDLVLKLISCNAVTENGYRILYYEGLYGNDYNIMKTINVSDYDSNINQMFYIVLTINPFHSIPIGIPDPEVVPLHHPHALPQIKIDIIDESKVNTSYMKENFLIVGKVNLINGNFSLDKEYIPAVNKIDYNKSLKAFKQGVFQVLLRNKNHSIQIFKKNKNNLKSNKLVENTFLLCEDINNFYSQNIFYLQSIIGEKSPICFVEKISMLANKLSISLNIIDERDRELLLQYYYEWTDVKPSYFLNIIDDVLNIQYNHIEISETIKKLNKFLSVIDGLLKKMSDLEYIGQRMDNIVISEESSISKEDKTGKSTWSIID